MAHADYDCCTICDSKMGYAGFESETKEEICEDCFENIRKLDLGIKNKEDFIKYVKEKDYKSLKENLLKLDFWFCYYNNEVDDEVIKRFAPSGMSLKNYIELVYERKDKQLQERIDKAIEYIEKNITFCENDSQNAYDVCNIRIASDRKLLEILKGKSE